MVNRGVEIGVISNLHRKAELDTVLRDEDALPNSRILRGLGGPFCQNGAHLPAKVTPVLWPKCEKGVQLWRIARFRGCPAQEFKVQCLRHIENLIADGDADPRPGFLPFSKKHAEGEVLDGEVRVRATR
jgi:hypothetical protein